MTAGTRTSPAATEPGAVAYRPVGAGVRLVRLYAVSRRVPVALGLLAAFGALLGTALHYHWSIAGGLAAQLVIPLTIETGAGAVVAVSLHGPFGEPERATGRWLPWLRLGTALALTGTGFGALAVGASAGVLPDGTLALLRNFAGTAGLGLLSAVALGGAFGWVGPMAYLLVTEVALNGHPTTPWVWAARPPHDHGAALCAALVFVAGCLAIALLGPRDAGGNAAPG
ncbi:MAG TPA: hypothetical protein VKB69_15120 [Micromonosporaceae bacterium]|nr:hypothetical protein [Micromonosporaceae bacterium]